MKNYKLSWYEVLTFTREGRTFTESGYRETKFDAKSAEHANEIANEIFSNIKKVNQHVKFERVYLRLSFFDDDFKLRMKAMNERP